MTTDLAMIEAALDAATPGPWVAVEHSTIVQRREAMRDYLVAMIPNYSPETAANRDLIVLLRNTAAELVERVKAAEAEVERLADWKASALPVMDGLQELGKSLGLPLGARITGPLAYVAAETLNARAETAEDTIASVRALAEEHPGTAWNSGLNLRQALRDALGGTPTDAPEGAELADDERNRFSGENTAGPTEPILCTDQRNWDRPEVALIRHMGGRTYARVGAHKWTELPKFGQVLVTEDLVAQQHEAIAVFIRPTDQRYEPPAVDDESGCCR